MVAESLMIEIGDLLRCMPKKYSIKNWYYLRNGNLLALKNSIMLTQQMSKIPSILIRVLYSHLTTFMRK